MPITNDYKTKYVDIEKKNPHSMLLLYKRLIDLRNSAPALQVGDFIPEKLNGDMMSYRRKFQEEEFLVIINFGKEQQEYKPEDKIKGTEIISTEAGKAKRTINEVITINQEEAVVIKLN